MRNKQVQLSTGLPASKKMNREKENQWNCIQSNFIKLIFKYIYIPLIKKGYLFRNPNYNKPMILDEKFVIDIIKLLIEI